MTAHNVPWPACWGSGQQDLVVADVAAQEEALMLAVHEPPAMRSLPVPLAGEYSIAGTGAPATQEDLREILCFSQGREGTVLVPIIGAPGSGKSHLIRWLAATMPHDSNLVVRHVPREGTSLSKVVEILFEGLVGPSFDALRDSLEKTRVQNRGLDRSAELDQVASRLVFRIAELLEYGLGTPWQRAADVPDEQREALRHRSVLPALITDPVIRERLTRPGGAVYRLASDIVEGYKRPEGDEQEHLGFTEADLNLVPPRGTGQLARGAFMKLKLAGWADAAARMLSDALEIASADVIGLGSISLTDLFVDLRGALFEDGKELVLLFEDIAIARGLQLDLVDALTTPARREGTKELCTLRVALAVTRNYWDEQAPETLSSRAHAWEATMFDLDSPRGHATDGVPELVGRYMNAARVGLENLRALGALKLAASVPNACVSCPLQEPCHATFGVTENGHGMFPLTPLAAKRLAGVADAQARPRLVLSDVVAPVLADREALANGAFPNAPKLHDLVAKGLATRRLDEAALDETERLQKSGLTRADLDRARVVLRVWTDGDPCGQEILETFALPVSLLEDAPPHPGRTTTEGHDRGEVGPITRTGQPGVVPDDAPASIPKVPADPDVRTIGEWAAGATDLPQALARSLRNALWEEVSSGVRWHEFAFKRADTLAALGLLSPNQQANIAIDIKRAAGGGALGATNRGEPLVSLIPDAANAYLLLAVHERAKNGGYDFHGGSEALARVRDFVGGVEATVKARLAEGWATKRNATDAAHLIALSSAPLSDVLRIEHRPSLDDVLRPIAAPVYGGLTDAWTLLRKESAQSHRWAVDRLQTVAARSQGERGGATALDATLVDVVVFDRDPAGTKRAKPSSGDIGTRHALLAAEMSNAVQAEAFALRAITDEVARLVGEPEKLPLKSIRDELAKAMDAARAAQLLGAPAAVARLEALKLPPATRAADAVVGATIAVRAAERDVVEAAVRLATTDRETLAVVREYLSLAAEIVDTTTATVAALLKERSSTTGDAAGTGIRSAVSEILNWCEALQ